MPRLASNIISNAPLAISRKAARQPPPTNSGTENRRAGTLREMGGAGGSAAARASGTAGGVSGRTGSIGMVGSSETGTTG
jgi:hypothetical protein